LGRAGPLTIVTAVLIFRVKSLSPDAPDDTTCILKLDVPAVVGIPLRVPLLCPRDRFGGSEPCVTDHVRPPDPPVAMIV